MRGNMFAERGCKIKAFVFIVLLAGMEAQQVAKESHIRHSPGFSSSATGLNARGSDTGLGAQSSGLEATRDNPDFQEHAKTMKFVAERMQAMKADPKLQEHTTRAVEHLEAMGVETKLQEQVKHMETLMANPKLDGRLELIGEKMKEVMADPTFQEQSKSVAEQVQAMIANPTLQEQAKLIGAQMEATMADAKLQEPVKRVGEQAKTMVEEIQKQATANPHLQDLVERVMEQMQDMNLANQAQDSDFIANLLHRGLGASLRQHADLQGLRASPRQHAALDSTMLQKPGKAAASHFQHADLDGHRSKVDLDGTTLRKPGNPAASPLHHVDLDRTTLHVVKPRSTSWRHVTAAVQQSSLGSRSHSSLLMRSMYPSVPRTWAVPTHQNVPYGTLLRQAEWHSPSRTDTLRGARTSVQGRSVPDPESYSMDLTNQPNQPNQQSETSAIREFLNPDPSQMRNDVEMPIFDHLEELRERVFIAAGATIFAILLCFGFSKDLVVFLEGPVQGVKFAQLAPGEFFGTTVKVAGYTGLLLSAPSIAYQIGAWVAPGLTVNEKKSIFPLFIAASVLFFVGVFFAYQVIAPAALAFFVDFSKGAVETLFSIDQYFGFILTLMIGVGISFQIPVVQILLGMSNIITSEQIFGAWRYVAVASTLVAAILTPSTDPFTQILLTIPLIGLYTIGGVAVKAIEQTRKA